MPWCVLFQLWSSAVILDITYQALPAVWGAGFTYPSQQARGPIFGGEAEQDMCYQLQYPQRQRERGVGGVQTLIPPGAIFPQIHKYSCTILYWEVFI